MEEKKRHHVFFKKRFWKLVCIVTAVVILFPFFQTEKINLSGPDEAYAQAIMLDDSMSTIPETNYQPPKSNTPGIGQKIKNYALGGLKAALLWCVNIVLFSIWLFLGILLAIAGLLFDWVVNPDVFTEVMKLSAITVGWRIVRDFFNIFFILVLLFSAFCTIFQVDRFNLKKILLTLIIMALLVNFSFPIARFIIDVSNVVMYYFLNQIQSFGTGPNSSPSSRLSSWSNVEYALIAKNFGYGKVTGEHELTLKLIASIIFLSVFTVTLLTLAFLLLIRILVLAVVVILSPIGLAAKILPGKLSSYADSWWDALFKQSFFGTVMAFMLYLAMMIMNEVNETFYRNIGQTNHAEEGLIKMLIVTGIKMAIPITILWIGIITAKRMGAEGAEYATGKASSLLKGAARKFSGANFMNRRYKAYQTERKKRSDEKFKGNIGQKLGSWANRGQDTIHGATKILPGAKAADERVKKMIETEKRAKMDDNAKKSEDTKTTVQMVNSVNNVFNATTGKIDSGTKITDDQAGDARAYTRKSGDDKKNFVETQFENKGVTYIPVGMENVFKSASPEVLAALDRVRDGGITHTESDLRKVAKHINDQMEAVIKQHLNPKP